MKVVDLARSSMTFRIDLDILSPRTLSHVPPYPMNNARVQLDSRCTITERATGQVHTFVLGVDCKTERVGAAADLWLEPNADFVPIFSDDEFMHLKTFARAGLARPAQPPATGDQSDRLTTPIVDSFQRVHLDLVERDGELLATAADIVAAVLANDALLGVHRFGNDRYTAVIEYPVKTINANERIDVYQTDTGPILFHDLSCPPHELLAGLELAFTAANQPDWAEFIVRVRTPVTDEVDVFHYTRTVRLDGIVNEFYRIPDEAPAVTRRVVLPASGPGQSSEEGGS